MDRLIEGVKSIPCLWDTNNPKYKDYEAMERAWSQVAEAVNYPDGKYAKMQWKRLRDNFREALKRENDQKRSLKRKVKSWRFKQNMEFLIPHMQSKGIDFISGDSITEESSDTVQSSAATSNSSLTQRNPKMVQIPVVVQICKPPQNSVMVQNSNNKVLQNSNNLSQNSIQVPQDSITLSQSFVKESKNFVKVQHGSEADPKAQVLHISEVFQSSEVPQSPEDKRRLSGECSEIGEAHVDSGSFFHCKRRKATDSSVAILDDGKESRESNSCGIVKGDALLNFFSSMYNTTSQLPLSIQLRVKRKIFEVVTEAEESCLPLKQEQEEYDGQYYC